MKKKILGLLMIVTLIAVGLTNCKKDDSSSPATSSLSVAYPWVLIIKRAGLYGDIKYGAGGLCVGFFIEKASSYVTDGSDIQSMSVTNPNSADMPLTYDRGFGYDLTIDAEGKYFHGYEPYKTWRKWQACDYRSVNILTGSYSISVNDTAGLTATGSATYTEGGGNPMGDNYPTSINYTSATRTLTWTAATGASYYRVLIFEGTYGSGSSAEDWSKLVYNSNLDYDGTISSTTHVIPSSVTLVSGTTYFIRVDGHDASDGHTHNANYVNRQDNEDTEFTQP